MIRVSVIIPCHNGEPYIGATLASLLRQGVSVHEIIVVDDNSTDDGAAIAASYPGPIRIVSGRYGSAAGARLAGVAAADKDAEAYFFLDADDILGRDALPALVETLAKTPDGIARCPWHRYELENGAWHVRPASCKPRKPGEDDLSAWLTGWYHPPCSVLWSRTAYERSGGWDTRENVNDDGDVMMRALIDGVTLTPAEGGEAFYRRLPGGGSLSDKRREAASLASRLRVIDRVRSRLAAKDRLETYVKPLGISYGLIAADADEHPEIAELAQDRARGVTTSWHNAHDAEPAHFDPSGKGSILPGAATNGTPGNENPLVSVIIPTYQRADETIRAARSVLSQSYRGLELLIVDDASADGTAEKLAVLDDPRVRLYRQEKNGGVAAARNRGIAEAKGELIAFLDSDDEWSSPAKLEQQVQHLLSAPRGTAICVTEGQNQLAEGDRQPFFIDRASTGFATLLERNCLHGACSSGLLRREVIDTVGGFDTSLPAIEDWEFWIRVARQFDIAVLHEDTVLLHDEVAAGRRSRNHIANIEARLMVYGLHEPAMREAGLVGPFLMTTARRLLRHQSGRSLRGLACLRKLSERYARSMGRSMLDQLGA